MSLQAKPISYPLAVPKAPKKHRVNNKHSAIEALTTGAGPASWVSDQHSRRALCLVSYSAITVLQSLILNKGPEFSFCNRP